MESVDIGQEVVKSRPTWNIYEAFAPLGILAKIVGIFPALNICHGPYVGREWISFFILPFVKIAEHLVLYYQDPQNLHQLFARFNTVRNYVDSLENYNELFSSSLQFVLMQVYFGQVCVIFERIANFDAKLNNTVNEQMQKTMVFLMSLIAMYVVFSLVEIFIIENYDDDTWGVLMTRLMHIVCTMVIFVPLFIIIFLSESIRRRFALITSEVKLITDRLPKTFSGNTSDNTVVDISDEPKLVDTLSDLCGACDELTDIISSMSRVLGHSLSLCFLSLLFDIIAMVSSIFLDDKGWTESMADLFGLLGEIVARVSILTLTTLMLSRIPFEATKSCRSLQRVRIANLYSDAKEMVLQLLERLSSRSFKITGADLFDIERNLLTAIGTVITTYVIVLVQFRDSETDNNRPKGNGTSY